ncbi:vitamin K-dependent gamma-carboxylase [bacterium]|nr:MAG: vitamin K-dependent gamma-carboxylase [bacterium]
MRPVPRPPPAVDIAPLALFRIAFGALMAVEMARFLAHDWVRALFVAPAYHFPYPGLAWLRPWPGNGMQWHFGLLLASAVLVALGVYYRAAMAAFALGFTYVFLLDAAFYQNHFYLICLLAWLMVFVPADRAWSVDAALGAAPRSDAAPGWALWLLRAQLAIVYTFAGLAKLNPDWLRGEPVRTFLATGPDVAPVGPLVRHPLAPWVLSYGGLVLDLVVVPALLWPRARIPALAAAIAFHLANAALFPIGIFPWLMIAALPLLLPPAWSRAALGALAVRPARSARAGARDDSGAPEAADVPPRPSRRRSAAIAAYLAVQVALPLRHLAYPGNPSWTGEGDRFAWRMMLDLKTGTTTYTVVDPGTGGTVDVDPRATLADWQHRKLAIRPDLILAFAHHLRDARRQAGRADVAVHAHAAMALNGRPPAPLVDPAVDLARVAWSPRPAAWILPPPRE